MAQDCIAHLCRHASDQSSTSSRLVLYGCGVAGDLPRPRGWPWGNLAKCALDMIVFNWVLVVIYWLFYVFFFLVVVYWLFFFIFFFFYLYFAPPSPFPSFPPPLPFPCLHAALAAAPSPMDG